MQLYFSPLACSMATRIALYEAGADAAYLEVDAKTKRLSDGSDFRAIHALGLVPTLRTDQGEVLTENAAILQYVADQFPAAGLAPVAGIERARLQQWLCFIGTELHKATFAPLLDPTAPAAVREYTVAKSEPRFRFVERHLEGRAFLLDDFSVADAYLVVVLGWSIATPLALDRWPGLVRYLARLRERPSIARAMQEERTLYIAEQQRQRASVA